MDVTRYLPLLRSRCLSACRFSMSGFGKLTAYGATTAYIGSVGLPLAPLGWAIAVAFEVGGGLLLMLGFRARAVAFGLAVFALATAVFFHRNFADQKSDDPFSQEHDDHRRAAADRAFWRRTLQPDARGPLIVMGAPAAG